MTITISAEFPDQTRAQLAADVLKALSIALWNPCESIEDVSFRLKEVAALAQATGRAFDHVLTDIATAAGGDRVTGCGDRLQEAVEDEIGASVYRAVDRWEEDGGDPWAEHRFSAHEYGLGR